MIFDPCDLECRDLCPNCRAEVCECDTPEIRSLFESEPERDLCDLDDRLYQAKYGRMA